MWRGGGFPEKHREFFTKGKVFRAPSYVATSFKRGTAEQFCRNAREQVGEVGVGFRSRVSVGVRVRDSEGSG